jgi:hypothetical protein
MDVDPNLSANTGSLMLKLELQSSFHFIFKAEFLPKMEESAFSSFALSPYICLLPVLQAFRNNTLGLLSQWNEWICKVHRRRTSNYFHVFLQKAFENDNFSPLVNNIANDGNSDFYSQLDLSMVCDNLIEAWDPLHKLSLLTGDCDIYKKIGFTARWFLAKSGELMNDRGSNNVLVEVKANCFRMSCLYLEYLEISNEITPGTPRLYEYGRIYKQMKELVEVTG